MFKLTLPTSSGDVLSISAESLDVVSSDVQNLSNIRRVIHGNTINPRFRISLLNRDDTVRYEIPGQDILANGSYSENYQNGQRRSLSFSLNNDSGKYTPSINGIWVGTRFLFEIGVELPDGSATIWFKKGIFVVKSANPSENATAKTVNIECTDKFGFLESRICALDETLTVHRDVDIENLITDVLGMNTQDGYIVDYLPFNYHPSFKGRKTPLTITEQSTYGALLIQLADILSAEIFYDSEGVLTILPIADVTQDADKPLIDTFSASEGDLQNNNFTFDFSSFVNRVVVIGGNINGHVCRAEARNDDPNSPLSVQRIGLRTAQVINDSNITNDILAQERADYELRKQVIAKCSHSSTIFFNPLLSVNNVVAVIDEFFELKKERFLLQNISFSLGFDGTMNISTSNLRDLPFEM